MWKYKKRFALAGFLHHNILELKDLLFFHSHFIDEKTEVWGDCELITCGPRAVFFTRRAAWVSSKFGEVLGRGVWSVLNSEA